MEFVKKFTPPDFQAKNFTPSISPNFNSVSGEKHKKLVKMEKCTPLADSTSAYAGSQLTFMTQHEKVIIFRYERRVTTDLLDV